MKTIETPEFGNATQHIYLQIYSKADLARLYESDEQYWNQPNIPITRLRISAYLANPNAEDDDTLLLTAWDGNLLIAYIGLVPELIHTTQGEQKINWLTSWWAEERYRGRGIAMRLFDLALAETRHAMTSSAHVQSSKRFHQCGKMSTYVTRERSFFFINISRKVLIDYKKYHGIFKYSYRFIHFISSLAMKYRYKWWVSVNPVGKDISLEYIRIPDQETMNFIQKNGRNDLAVKNKANLTWRMDLHFLSTQPRSISWRNSSYFAILGERFENFSAKVFNNATMTAFISFQIVDGVLRLPYFYILPGSEKQIAALIGKLVSDYQIDVINTHNPLVIKILNQYKLPFLFKKSHTVEAMRTNDLDLEPELLIQDGDGAI
ncbi:MAG: GNAT family N-acetyltransferase [Candidatus Cloacimonetes bacterium]|nr:GNAT family N-acetyltransferase [Candidatus Cloacimonadota bacterium]